MSSVVTKNHPPAGETFWQRRIVAPIVVQLKQGISPEKIALTVALVIVLGIFPILGSTTILCGLAAVVLKLNQPIIQLVNYFAYPLQLAFIIPIYRLGETLFHQPHIRLSIPLLFERFRTDFPQFLRDFGMIALQGIVVWCLLAPPATALLYYSVRTPLRALRQRLRVPQC
jgi:uncharacterized protein (DUF2062 family)